MSINGYKLDLSFNQLLRDFASEQGKKLSNKLNKDLSFATTLIHITRNVASYPILHKLVKDFVCANPEINNLVLKRFPSLKMVNSGAKTLEVLALGASTIYLYKKYSQFKKENAQLSEKFTETQGRVTDVLLKSVSDVFLQNTRNLLGVRSITSSERNQETSLTQTKVVIEKQNEDHTKLAFRLMFAALAICIFDPNNWGLLTIINENKNPLIMLGLYKLAVSIFTNVPRAASSALSSVESRIIGGVQAGAKAVEETVDERLSQIRRSLGE